jgi:hypothetical protein
VPKSNQSSVLLDGEVIIRSPDGKPQLTIEPHTVVLSRNPCIREAHEVFIYDQGEWLIL